MSDSTNPIANSGAPEAFFPSQKAQNLAPSGGAASAQTFSTMESLRKADPKVAEAMIKGCMSSFCKAQTRSNERIKKIMRENEN